MRSFRSIRVVNLLSFNMLSLSPFILIIYRDTQPNSYLFRSFRFMHFAFSYIDRPLSTWCVLDAWSMFFIAANLIVYALCQFFPIRLDSTQFDSTRLDRIRFVTDFEIARDDRSEVVDVLWEFYLFRAETCNIPVSFIKNRYKLDVTRW